jgi:prepilin-type N-terminal cleavage/methylation domain-containing protein
VVRDAARRPAKSSGFTLIELMIAVCIIGILASVAIPAYTRFVMEARSSEVEVQLKSLYSAVAAYWDQPFTGQRGSNVAEVSHCELSDDDGGVIGVPPFPPGPEKRLADWSAAPQIAQSGVGPAGYLYGTYAYAPRLWGGQCGLTEADFAGGPGAGVVYTLMGIIDLDGDGMVGGGAMMVGIRGDQLFRAPGMLPATEAMVYFGAGVCGFCADTFVD